ncbi:hypothetical protein CCAX7_55970 [Capsulimonas corticalis]|uniref:Ricin B lectin domain-containing protein n=2 Tax=Capsulimonas corticalis TaxID=2219043 RepID=A0A402D0U5_9BACT|nr:hypothetical protein CCAX7_55970 [Capsulimonas corticalis]
MSMRTRTIAGPLKGLAATLLAAAALLSAPAVHAQNAANADAAFNSFLSAYLVRSGGQTYFVDGLNKRDKAFFWGQCYMITMVEDAYDRSPTPANKQLIIDLENSQINQDTTSWSWDGWNDDVEWGIIAAIRAYKLTGNTTYRDVAANNWNMVWNRAWDGALGGGVWENQDKFSKCALSNDPLIITGCMLYQATGDATYLNKCTQQIYPWMRSHVFNTSTGQVNEGVDNTGALQPSQNVYNSGAFILAANALYKATGNQQYYNDAKLAADFIVNSTPTLYHNGTDGSWADQFVRGLSRFARENNLWGTYSGWLNNQAAAAWNHRRTDLNLTDNNWLQNTPGGETYAMNALSAVVVQLVTQINPLTGSHVVVNKLSNKAMENGGSLANNAGIIQWGKGGQPWQTWEFTQNSDTSWNIVNAYSTQGLDTGGSTTNGTQLIQWPADSSNNNQRWWVDGQSDGSFKIWSKANSKSLDNSSSTADGYKIVLWDWNGGNQQRWLLR